MYIHLLYINIFCVLLSSCMEPNVMSFFQKGYPPQDLSEITESLYNDIIQDAFDIWSCYIGIQFVRTHDIQKADISIIFGGYNHQSVDKNKNFVSCPQKVFGSSPSHGSQVTGHATYLYHKTAPGNIHLDSSEVWVYHQKDSGSSSLLDTMVHEIGHVLGVGHNEIDKSSVMFPGPRNWIDPKRMTLPASDRISFDKTWIGRQLAKLGIRPNASCRKTWQEKYYERMKGTIPCRDVKKDCVGRYYSCEVSYGHESAYCRDTCSFCGCKDLGSYCTPDLCLSNDQKDKNTHYCRKTCGYCPYRTLYWTPFRNSYFSRKECVDEIDFRKCAAAGNICTDPMRKVPAYKFCRKYCGFCK